MGLQANLIVPLDYPRDPAFTPHFAHALRRAPHAQDVRDAQGGYLQGVDADRWQGYLDRGDAGAPRPGAFRRDPAQGNAP